MPAVTSRSSGACRDRNSYRYLRPHDILCRGSRQHLYRIPRSLPFQRRLPLPSPATTNRHRRFCPPFGQVTLFQEMGKPTTTKKKTAGTKPANPNSKHTQKVFDEDTTIFIDMAQDMKEEGNKLFQKRDYEGAMLKYEKAIKLLPKTHIDSAYLRSNLAACYMQMNPPEYHRAINECNLGLESSPKYSKALLKRARCFEALDRLDLAWKDVDLVLTMEPNNMTALEISDRVKKAMEKRGVKVNDKEVVAPLEVAPVIRVKEKTRKKKNQKAVDKVVVEEKKCSTVKEQEPMKNVKLVFGEDIRLAQIPANCSISQLRDVVRSKYPSLKAVLVKYKDREGDLVTITCLEELKGAVETADSQGSARLYIAEVSPEQEPLFDEEKKEPETLLKDGHDNLTSKDDDEKSNVTCVDDWIVQFAGLFKNHVGFNSDAYLDLHELGMKLYSEAMEETATSEEAQPIFKIAEEKFQEMAALALFNWGNVHMSRARKRLLLDDASTETILAQVKIAYDWARAEYIEAGRRYEEAVKIKPDFYEGLLALGHQQFEQAKLCWYFAIGSKVDLETWPSDEVLELFNNAEDNMERGTEMWDEMEERRLKELPDPNKEKELLEKMGISGLFKEISPDEAAERSSNMRAQVNLLWGTMLYERSVIEFRLSIPVWEECLMASIEKFKLAGASATDIAVMIKNHCANETAQDGLGFKIDEIVQAWNEMYDAKRWISGVPSFRLEPLFRRRVPKLHQVLEHV